MDATEQGSCYSIFEKYPSDIKLDVVYATANYHVEYITPSV